MKKKKFNIIDGLIIILLIAVGIGGYMYLKKDDGGPAIVTGKQKVEIVVEAYKVNPEVCDQIAIGDQAVAAGYYVDAFVTDVFIENDKTVGAANGEIVALEDPTLRHIVVTFEANCNRYGSYMDVGGQEVKVGKQYYIKTARMAALGTIIEVKLIEE